MGVRYVGAMPVSSDVVAVHKKLYIAGIEVVLIAPTAGWTWALILLVVIAAGAEYIYWIKKWKS